jgi:hypothetical protein
MIASSVPKDALIKKYLSPLISGIYKKSNLLLIPPHRTTVPAIKLVQNARKFNSLDKPGGTSMPIRDPR